MNPWHRPRSDFVAGRRAAIRQFNEGVVFAVSAYDSIAGRRYTGPVFAPPSNKKRILYRIRVMPKPGAQLLDR